MVNTELEYLQKGLRNLVEALKADSSPKSTSLVNFSLRGIGKVLDSTSGRQDAKRQGEISCISTFVTKYCLVESYLHFMKNLTTPIDQEVLYSAVSGFANIFNAVVHETPDGKPNNDFLCHLAENCYVEITGQLLLSALGKNIPLALGSIKPSMDKLIRIGVEVYSLDVDQLQNNRKLLGGQSSAIKDLYKNFLLCVILYTKLLLRSHVASIGPQTRGLSGAHSSASQSSGQSSTSTASKASAPAEKDNPEAYLQQHLLQLHGHLLQAVKLMEPTLASLAPWEDVRGLVLTEDLLSIELPRIAGRPPKENERWEQLVYTIDFFFELLKLLPGSRPLEEVAVEMALEAIMALRASTFMLSLSFVRTLGLYVWKSIYKNPHKEKNARVTVRLLFATQLNLEAKCLYCRPEEKMLDLMQKAAPMEEYPEYPGVQSAFVRLAKIQATECVMCRSEVVETAQLLYDRWMLTVDKQWKSGEASDTARFQTLRVMHEEAIEALLERQIRWICGTTARWIPLHHRTYFLRFVAAMVWSLVTEAPAFCVGSHMSICASLTKAIPLLVDEFHCQSLADQLKVICIEAFEDVFNLLALYTKLCVSNSRLSVLIGASGDLSIVQTLKPLDSSGRYIRLKELLATECATLVYYSMPALLQMLTDLTKTGNVDEAVLDMSTRMPRLLTTLLEYVTTKGNNAMKCWLVGILLHCSFVTILKRIYITAPLEITTLPLSVPIAAAKQAELYYHITMLNHATGQMTHVTAALGKSLIGDGLFDEMLNTLTNMKPDLNPSSPTPVKYMGTTVDVLKAPDAVIWAMCWISFFKVVLTVLVRVLKESPFTPEDPMYQIFHTPWDPLPRLGSLIKDGPGEWVVVRDRNPFPTEDPNANKEEALPLFWLTKTDSGKVKRNSYGMRFLPSSKLIRVMMGCMKLTVERVVKIESTSRKEKLGPPESIRPPIPVGCWSRGCRNVSGHSEACLPTHICARCRTARYCCRSCQMADWLQHKQNCRAWEEEVEK